MLHEGSGLVARPDVELRLAVAQADPDRELPHVLRVDGVHPPHRERGGDVPAPPIHDDWRLEALSPATRDTGLSGPHDLGLRLRAEESSSSLS